MPKTTLILLLIPIAIVQLGLQITAIVSLIKRKKVRFDNKLIWAAIICTGILGSVVYYIAGGDKE